jgi:V8-like Glu-specific endopeptidase
MTQARSFGGTPAVGALAMLTAAGGLGKRFCSASVIDSPAGNLVITAAHCLAGRQAGQFVFMPGYDNGQAPYGAWPVRRVITDQDWASSSDPDDDVAFVELTRAVQDVTGAERLGTGQPSGQLVTVIGYPDNQDSAIFCVSYSSSFSATQLVFRCGGYTTGTSGSPLLAHVDAATGLGTVIGVIGGYQQGGAAAAISYAAALGPDIAALYQAAIAGP